MMYTLTIFGLDIKNGYSKCQAEIVEDGLRKLEVENKLESLTHCPATKTIYYNGNAIGCWHEQA